MSTSSSLVARPEYWPLGMDHGRVILRSAMFADTSRNRTAPSFGIGAARELPRRNMPDYRYNLWVSDSVFTVFFLR